MPFSGLQSKFKAELLGAVLHAIPEPFFVIDQNGFFVDVLGGHDRSSYHESSHLIGQSIYDIFAVDLAEKFLSKIHEALNHQKVVSYVYQLGRGDIKNSEHTTGPLGRQWFKGRIYPVSVADKSMRMVVWIAFDITDLVNTIEEKKTLALRLEAANKELKALSTIDSLTRIYNRRYFDDFFDVLWRSAQRDKRPLSLVMFDVDFFKRFNDFYGHQKGDECLREVAKAASLYTQRAQDTICRYGGEEFVVLLSLPLDGAAVVAEKIRQQIQALNIPHKRSKLGIVTISAGVSCMVPSRDLESSELIRQADQALYLSKHSGRNRVTLFYF